MRISLLELFHGLSHKLACQGQAAHAEDGSFPTYCVLRPSHDCTECRKQLLPSFAPLLSHAEEDASVAMRRLRPE